jgi:hypothetical protein
MYVNRSLPWESRFLILYLFLVLGISLVKSVGLVRQLWSFSRSRWAPLRKPDSGSGRANLLAASGLANRLPPALVDGTPSGTTFLPVVRQAELRFRYLWERCSAKVASLKRVVPLTCLLAVFVLVSRTIDIAGEVAIRKIAGIAFLAGSIAEGLVSLALGIAVCGFCEGVLQRRRASWNYFLQVVTNQAPAE